jgi:hypothetical protein
VDDSRPPEESAFCCRVEQKQILHPPNFSGIQNDRDRGLFNKLRGHGPAARLIEQAVRARNAAKLREP